MNFNSGLGKAHPKLESKSNKLRSSDEVNLFKLFNDYAAHGSGIFCLSDSRACNPQTN